MKLKGGSVILLENEKAEISTSAFSITSQRMNCRPACRSAVYFPDLKKPPDQLPAVFYFLEYPAMPCAAGF
jgi:hypothetical protein